MSDEATPRPWRCNAKVGYIWGDDKNPKANCQIAVVGGFVTDKDLVPWNGKRWSADTELIVRAVNSHEALIEALTACLPFIDDAMDAHTVMSESAVTDECRNAVNAARSALAKAQVTP